MMKPIFILNGPNLNLLGQREPEIYGHETLDDIRHRCAARAAALAMEIDFRQSDFEGEIVESVHEARGAASAIIIGLGAHGYELAVEAVHGLLGSRIRKG